MVCGVQIGENFLKKKAVRLCGLIWAVLSLQPQTGGNEKADNGWGREGGPHIVEEFIDRRKAKGFGPVGRTGQEKSLSQKRSLGHRKNERRALRGSPKDYTMESLILAQDER